MESTRGVLPIGNLGERRKLTSDDFQLQTERAGMALSLQLGICQLQIVNVSRDITAQPFGGVADERPSFSESRPGLALAPTVAMPVSPSSWRIFSSISLPGLKVTTLFGPTSTRSPVRGLRALRALRRLTSNTPKLRNSIRPSSRSVATMASKVF